MNECKYLTKYFSLETHAYFMYLLRLKSELYFIQSSPIYIYIKLVPKWKQLRHLQCEQKPKTKTRVIHAHHPNVWECVGFAVFCCCCFELDLRAPTESYCMCSDLECKIIVVNTHVYILFMYNLKMVLAQPNRQKSQDAWCNERASTKD